MEDYFCKKSCSFALLHHLLKRPSLPCCSVMLLLSQIGIHICKDFRGMGLRVTSYYA